MTFLYVPPDSIMRIPMAARVGWKRRLGVEITTDHTLANAAMPLIESFIYRMVREPKFKHLSPMTAEQHMALCDRINIRSLDVPSLPAVIPRKKEDLWALGDIPLFIKTRRTLFKETDGKNGASYTSWASPQAAADGLPAEFWIRQDNPSEYLGEYVITPLVTDFANFDPMMAVNSTSDPIVWDRIHSKFISTNRLGDAKSWVGQNPPVVAKIRQLIHSMKLGPGFHSVQCCLYDGQWVVNDWNPRVYTGLHLIAASRFPSLDEPLAHILDLPVPTPVPSYWEQRPYWDRTLPATAAFTIAKLGLFSRHENMENTQQITRVLGMGDTKRSVTDLFNLFESSIV